MFTTNRKLAYTILWLLNHIPFYRNQFEVETITVEFDPRIEAEWTTEDRLRLEEILRGGDE